MRTEQEAIRIILEKEFPKRCTVCGRVFSKGSWAELECKGNQSDPCAVLELRNCPCGSTLGVVVAIHDLPEYLESML
jgi:hypothetical protein